MDSRLQNYIRKHSLILDLTQGGICECDGKTAKHIESNGKVIKEILPLPAFINGKFIDELTLEEFMEWERSFHCVEGKGRFDKGEGGDG